MGDFVFTNMIEIEVTKKADENKAILSRWTFTNAFDKVQHGRLLWKVRYHEMQGELAD